MLDPTPTLVAPVVAPILFLFLRSRNGVVQFLDGFVAVAVPGLVFLHVVPDSVAEGELGVLVMLGIGLAERVGLIAVLLKYLMMLVPTSLLTPAMEPQPG